MTTTLQDILPILNLPCGDVLKAHLLSHFHPEIPRLNPIWLQGSPLRDAETAAAAAREALKGIPAPDRLQVITKRAAADDKLAEFKADHKPPKVVAEHGKVHPVNQPLVVPITNQASVTQKRAGGGSRFQPADIKSQITEAKAAGILQAREEPVKLPDAFPVAFQIEGKEWVLIKEAARRLGLNPQAVYYQCTNSKVPFRQAPEAHHPATKVYLWERVQAVLASKLSAVDK